MLGNSCSGVTSREGVGESMSDLALMAISGPAHEYGYAAVRGIYGTTLTRRAKRLSKFCA